jgi:hypothetical protein
MHIELRQNDRCNATVKLHEQPNTGSPIEKTMMNWVYPDPRYFISSTNQVILNYSHQNLYPNADDTFADYELEWCNYRAQLNMYRHTCPQPSSSFTRLPSMVNFTIRFFSHDLSFYHALPVSRTSDTTGYVASPGFDEGFHYTSPFDGWANLTVPINHSVMVSFPVFNIYSTKEYSYDILEFTVYHRSKLGLRYQSGNKNESRQRLQYQSKDIVNMNESMLLNFPYQQAYNEVIVKWSETGSKSVPAQVYHGAALITLHLFSLLHLKPVPDDTRPIELGGFKMLYSFHPISDRLCWRLAVEKKCSIDV